jgi:hypothetical protein
MSWNLLICKSGETPETLAPLGHLAAVKQAFTAAFIGLEWVSATEAALPVDGGFRLVLAVERGAVQDVYTHGGFNHIRQFAALCKREGWLLTDAQEGEEVDLDDPQRWYEERSG